MRLSGEVAKVERSPPRVSTLSRDQLTRLKLTMAPDEWANTLGVCNVIITGILAFRWPEHFWIWHVCKTALLFSARYVRFRKEKLELYLLDWCYVVSYLTLIGTGLALLRTELGYVTPLARHNSALVKAVFATASGPLAWSVFIFSNSLVMHDIENMTSGRNTIRRNTMTMLASSDVTPPEHPTAIPPPPLPTPPPPTPSSSLLAPLPRCLLLVPPLGRWLRTRARRRRMARAV